MWGSGTAVLACCLGLTLGGNSFGSAPYGQSPSGQSYQHKPYVPTPQERAEAAAGRWWSVPYGQPPPHLRAASQNNGAQNNVAQGGHYGSVEPPPPPPPNLNSGGYGVGYGKPYPSVTQAPVRTTQRPVQDTTEFYPNPTDAPFTDPPFTDPPFTDPPFTDPPFTEPPFYPTDYPEPLTDYPVTDYPAVTEPPVTDYPFTDYPFTDYPFPDYTGEYPDYPGDYGAPLKLRARLAAQKKQQTSPVAKIAKQNSEAKKAGARQWCSFVRKSKTCKSGACAEAACELCDICPLGTNSRAAVLKPRTQAAAKRRLAYLRRRHKARPSPRAFRGSPQAAQQNKRLLERRKALLKLKAQSPRAYRSLLVLRGKRGRRVSATRKGSGKGKGSTRPPNPRPRSSRTPPPPRRLSSPPPPPPPPPARLFK